MTIKSICNRIKIYYKGHLMFKRKSDKFIDKLTMLLRAVIPYYYNEKKSSEIPDFSHSVKVTTNPIYNYFNYIKAKRDLKKLDLSGLEWTYNALSDEYSKETMLLVIIYKLFKKVKLRFPLFYSDYFDKLQEFDQLIIDDQQISCWFDLLKLRKYNLNPLGYNLVMWENPVGLLIEFVQEQYRYKNIVKVEEYDNVIDGGGCYGDTALYFASKSKGQVYSFEFIEENIEIFNKNLLLNPKVKDRIKLIQHPLSQKSNELIYATFNGPGTAISSKSNTQSQTFTTLSIDDFVLKNNIEKIDFIKLDCEGSEESILRGAEKTIKKFKPKLAICVYHKPDDLVVMPKLVKELVSDYKLYLKHNTIMSNETVLYATI